MAQLVILTLYASQEPYILVHHSTFFVVDCFPVMIGCLPVSLTTNSTIKGEDYACEIYVSDPSGCDCCPWDS